MESGMTDLEKQVDAAYDYRGYVTIQFKDGKNLEGFVYNREFANPLAKEDHYIDVFLKDGSRQRFPFGLLAGIQLTGEDCAAGNSYEDYMKKKAAEAKK